MARKVKQFDLFGHPIEEPKPQQPKTEIMPLEFEGVAVRATRIGEDPWWVAADVCKVLGIGNPSQAITRLDDDEKGVITNETLGGRQSLTVVNESGLYALVITSRKPAAKAFRKWITSEVVPQIRKTGKYVSKPSRIARTAKRLGCCHETAKVRVKLCDTNKAMNRRLAKQGAKPRDYQQAHNAASVGAFGRTCSQLRDALGKKGSPSDHMGAMPLSILDHAKVTVAKMVEMGGGSMSFDVQSRLLEEVAREVSVASLARLGSGCVHRIIEDPARGKIIDVIRALPAPSAA